MVAVAHWKLSDRRLDLDGPVGVGIVNVTVDSMFEGARSGRPERAIEDGLGLAKAGFEMLDVGAVEGGRGAKGAPEAGAVAINDIGGGSDQMLELAAGSGCGLVIMHIEGPPREDRPPRAYDNPVDHLKGWFADRLDAAVKRGVEEEQIVLDPGLDFDLSVADDLEVMRRLPELKELGRPLYVSLSRKDFLGAVLAGSWEERAPATDREWATAAAVALAVTAGADLLRLHDESALQSMRIAAAIEAPRGARVG
jgi:dihydropteroate synthase